MERPLATIAGASLAASESTASSQHRRRRRRQVWKEEDYTATLEQIIQRDYFPDEHAQPVTQFASVSDFHARVTSEDNAYFLNNQQQQVALHEQEKQRYFSSSSQGKMSIPNVPALTSSSLVHSPLPLASDQFLLSPSLPCAVAEPAAVVPLSRKQRDDSKVSSKRVEPRATRFPSLPHPKPRKLHCEGNDSDNETLVSNLDAPPSVSLSIELRQGKSRKRTRQEDASRGIFGTLRRPDTTMVAPRNRDAFASALRAAYSATPVPRRSPNATPSSRPLRRNGS
jgi:Nuclear protein Es2